MARKGRASRREVPPDARYGSELVARFINHLMRGGEKSIAESIIYRCLDIMGKKTGEPALKVFTKAVDNVKPLLEVRSRRVGGATYQIPVDVRPGRRVSLAIRWIIQAARQRKGKGMSESLAEELMQAAKGEGVSMKKKEDTHRMAEANKAFAHYRW